ncbi:DUF1839 family protein [Tengunoibacter tsumagoiensis]|uniref:DUF1839 domain-containing protein n=1 Tax=Tengunoibacter tsumagoiensis TaxID=2014871 RepID=A0A402A1C2_9CHLR|nr:DUF1839 family protein [Tengunoibacter tsumagoiensis]GCE12856.1 hypothetical protein KTT_27150 [Tengunoibacter tsumagoiensis]
MAINTAFPMVPSSAYTPHWLHNGERIWPQSNCYMDLWIEALHALHLHPIASFAFTIGIDFEGDQWTFFKVPSYDLLRLYGIDVQELNIWHAMLDHLLVQVGKNRLVLIEVDAFYLPDVHATNYHQQHEKTTIGVQMIDLEQQKLGYFHNSSYYTLQGEDFVGIFQLEGTTGVVLPPYVEIAKLNHLKRLNETELQLLSTELLREHYQRRPDLNPFLAYRQAFQGYLDQIQAQNLADFHGYAFAHLRQFGASYEYASLFLRWLASSSQDSSLLEAAKHFEEISTNAQTLLLKTARTAHNKKPFAIAPFFDALEDHWEQAMHALSYLLR